MRKSSEKAVTVEYEKGKKLENMEDFHRLNYFSV